MDNSQTPVKKDPGDDEIANGEHLDESPGGYYYDDSTGYQRYDDDDDENDEEEGSFPDS